MSSSTTHRKSKDLVVVDKSTRRPIYELLAYEIVPPLPEKARPTSNGEDSPSSNKIPDESVLDEASVEGLRIVGNDFNNLLVSSDDNNAPAAASNEVLDDYKGYKKKGSKFKPPRPGSAFVVRPPVSRPQHHNHFPVIHDATKAKKPPVGTVSNSYYHEIKLPSKGHQHQDVYLHERTTTRKPSTITTTTGLPTKTTVVYSTGGSFETKGYLHVKEKYSTKTPLKPQTTGETQSYLHLKEKYSTTTKKPEPTTGETQSYLHLKQKYSTTTRPPADYSTTESYYTQSYLHLKEKYGSSSSSKTTTTLRPVGYPSSYYPTGSNKPTTTKKPTSHKHPDTSNEIVLQRPGYVVHINTRPEPADAHYKPGTPALEVWFLLYPLRS
jgi:hypothetical protein